MRTAKELFAELNSFDENRRIEAKSASAVGKSMMETVCAFANEPGLCGGYLLLGAKRTGIAEDGRPIYEPENIEYTDKIQSDFVAMCNSMFNVRIRPIINVEEYLGKTVIVVKIEELPESQKPAYFAKRGLPEGTFRRIGPSDEKCSEEDMYLFYQSADTYDSCIVDDADLDDIDENALNFYRKLRKEVNPDAEELTLNDVDLLRALGAIKKNKQGGYDLTYTGLLVFGKQMSLRRLVPSFRVDYIRISGNQWLADGDNRFEQTIDMRGPLILMVNKACSAVMDDLPKGFELKKDSMQASTPAILPNKVLREAIVNSYIHRSNRVNQPIQIIRYSNRIEIHNPGYSLKPQDDWGEPGSMLRNPRISEIFHDTNLAETKGTGIGAMRRLMKEAGLMPPTFESNHEANKFTARLLLYHFLSKENMEWLAQYAEFGLVNEQKLALVFVREVGAIGIEREYRAKEAGFRTHFLVALGSALFCVVSQYGFGFDLKDSSRVAAQVVSGIGFLGAGTIIFQKNVVRGLTTAAGLWVTAAIGLACGTGMYVAAAITTMMVLMGLEVLNYLIPQLGTSTIELNFSAPSRDSVKEFISKIKQKGMEVHSYELKERRFSKEEFVEASIEIKAKRGFHTLEILDYMNDFSDVTISTIK